MRSEAEKAALEVPKAAGERLKRHSGLNASEVEANHASFGDTSAPAPEGTWLGRSVCRDLRTVQRLALED